MEIVHLAVDAVTKCDISAYSDEGQKCLKSGKPNVGDTCFAKKESVLPDVTVTQEDQMIFKTRTKVLPGKPKVTIVNVIEDTPDDTATGASEENLDAATGSETGTGDDDEAKEIATGPGSSSGPGEEWEPETPTGEGNYIDSPTAATRLAQRLVPLAKRPAHTGDWR